MPVFWFEHPVIPWTATSSPGCGPPFVQLVTVRVVYCGERLRAAAEIAHVIGAVAEYVFS